MSEKKEKKQDVAATQGDVDSLAGFAALVSAIMAASEPPFLFIAIFYIFDCKTTKETLCPKNSF